MPSPVFLGLDVARDQLEVAVYPTGEGWRVPNTPTGHARRRPGFATARAVHAPTVD